MVFLWLLSELEGIFLRLESPESLERTDVLLVAHKATYVV